MQSEKVLRYRDSYTLSAYLLNRANPNLAGLLTAAGPITPSEWEQAARGESVFYQDGYTFADYQAYRSAVYETYCHPCGVSEKVGAVLEEIGSRTADRWEAARMLEAYLGRMEYSTDCGALPDSVSDPGSFLDYFLFTAQKGYCMHFATAFVLMANEMGIPCRYVQGYSVLSDGAGQFTVRQSDAHAWPEVYFDHVGWVTFEPTPGIAASTGWQIRKQDPAEAGQSIQPPETVHEPEKIDEQPADSEPERRRLNPMLFVVPVCGVIGFLILILLFSRAASRRKYRRMGFREKYRYLTQQNLRLLGYLGFRMEGEETLEEYRRRIMS